METTINIMNFESTSEEFASISDRRKSSPSSSVEKAMAQDKTPKESLNSAHSSPIASTASAGDDDVNNVATPSDNVHPAGWNFSMNIPQTTQRTSIEIPAEEIGHGVNRHVYYACTNLCDDWIELPSATPHQINVSRRIRKYLTGNLDAEMCSYPSFPGTERHYLRALIARISAGTHVAPQNYFKIERDDDGEESDSDNEENRKSAREKLCCEITRVHFSPQQAMMDAQLSS
jgi:hypothetical protein